WQAIVPAVVPVPRHLVQLPVPPVRIAGASRVLPFGLRRQTSPCPTAELYRFVPRDVHDWLLLILPTPVQEPIAQHRRRRHRFAGLSREPFPTRHRCGRLPQPESPGDFDFAGRLLIFTTIVIAG